MKILINTNYNAAGTKVCVEDMAPRLIKAGHKLARNDWDNYQNYDVILFMAPDSQVRKARATNKNAVIGIMDPKLSKKWQTQEARAADFLLVSSLEQREAFLKYNPNCFIYYMFPDIKEKKKAHTKKEKIIIGYHGNKLHLHCFYPKITKALEKLSSLYDIELWAIYNIKNLGKWKKGVPKNLKVRHIQWSEDAYHKYLSQCDIGIVNNEIPIARKRALVFSKQLRYLFGFNFGYDTNDYLVRFKFSSNPGRIYVFSQLYIPVVTDFSPSSGQIVSDCSSGFIVNSEEGWFHALEKLIRSHELRAKFALNLKKFIDNNFSIEKNFKRFSDYLQELSKKKAFKEQE